MYKSLEKVEAQLLSYFTIMVCRHVVVVLDVEVLQKINISVFSPSHFPFIDHTWWTGSRDRATWSSSSRRCLLDLGQGARSPYSGRSDGIKQEPI